jgi:hypothetical protein
MLPDIAVVVESCAGVDDRIGTDTRTGLNYGSGHDLRACAKHNVLGDDGRWMNDSRELKASRREALVDVSPCPRPAHRANTVDQHDFLRSPCENDIVPAEYSRTEDNLSMLGLILVDHAEHRTPGAAKGI